MDMTDMLDEAIGAVRFANGQTGNVHFVATIMKAVARGELIRATPEALAASPEVQALIADAEARGMERAAARARVYASNYEQSSDGRNTFILLAEWADAEAAAIRGETP